MKELYLLAVANAENIDTLNAILETSAYDETLTKEEYTEIYEAIDFKIRIWAYA